MNNTFLDKKFIKKLRYLMHSLGAEELFLILQNVRLYS